VLAGGGNLSCAVPRSCCGREEGVHTGVAGGNNTSRATIAGQALDLLELGSDTSLGTTTLRCWMCESVRAAAAAAIRRLFPLLLTLSLAPTPCPSLQPFGPADSFFRLEISDSTMTPDAKLAGMTLPLATRTFDPTTASLRSQGVMLRRITVGKCSEVQYG
jgi:hypothetical protein